MTASISPPSHRCNPLTTLLWWALEDLILGTYFYDYSGCRGIILPSQGGESPPRSKLSGSSPANAVKSSKNPTAYHHHIMAGSDIPSVTSLDRPEKYQDLLKQDRGEDCLPCRVVGEPVPPGDEEE